MENEALYHLKLEIDSIKEYLDNSMCNRCLEMSKKLDEYENMLWQYCGSGLSKN
jgi:hypothetical protein